MPLGGLPKRILTHAHCTIGWGSQVGTHVRRWRRRGETDARATALLRRSETRTGGGGYAGRRVVTRVRGWELVLHSCLHKGACVASGDLGVQHVRATSGCDMCGGSAQAGVTGCATICVVTPQAPKPSTLSPKPEPCAGGRHWVCNMCGMNNPVDPDYYCNLDAQVTSQTRTSEWGISYTRCETYAPFYVSRRLTTALSYPTPPVVRRGHHHTPPRLCRCPTTVVHPITPHQRPLHIRQYWTAGAKTRHTPSVARPTKLSLHTATPRPRAFLLRSTTLPSGRPLHR